jgi:hypothetical protein
MINRKLDYYIFEGYDHYNNYPLYRVESTSNNENEYVGEWNMTKEEAEKELDDLHADYEHKLNLRRNERFDVGGKIVGNFYFDSRKDKTFRVISIDDMRMGIQYFDRSKKPMGDIEFINKQEFDYYIFKGAWAEYKQPYFEDGGSVDGGDYVREDLNFYKNGGGVTDADLNFYVYPTKVVKIAYLGKIQMGYHLSLKDAMKEIEHLTMAYPKNEIEKYAIITPNKTFHLGEKEYPIRFNKGGEVGEFAMGGNVGFKDYIVYEYLTKNDVINGNYEIVIEDADFEQTEQQIIRLYQQRRERGYIFGFTIYQKGTKNKIYESQSVQKTLDEKFGNDDYAKGGYAGQGMFYEVKRKGDKHFN